MQKIHDEQNINIRFLNKDRISNCLAKPYWSLRQKEKPVILILSFSRISIFLSQFFALIFIYLNIALEYYLNIALEYY